MRVSSTWPLTKAQATNDYDRDTLDNYYSFVRNETERLSGPLSDEDQVVQSMPDASPTKWHRAHVTWFFETMILLPNDSSYSPFNEKYAYLYNSYYESLGARQPRAERGLLTRPSTSDISDYREYVDVAMSKFIRNANDEIWQDCRHLTELGINHEQQHQELILMDILHAFSHNDLYPAYQKHSPIESKSLSPLTWKNYEEGTYEIGHVGEGFSFDNEGPHHKIMIPSFFLASRPVINSEWKKVIEKGGYERPELWLSDGWSTVKDRHWTSPLYWKKIEDKWMMMSLSGLHPLDMDSPVCNISYYEADAYARWANKRLPTEFEWEIAAKNASISGNFLCSGLLRPVPGEEDETELPQKLFGDVWEWTQSSYSAYPGFRPEAGAVGEYNGKFMLNQMVLRGGACITPMEHMRVTYRNFFYPHMRWQFAGMRLADDV